MKTQLGVIGVCSGCYDDILENEQYYMMDTKNGTELVHAVVSCCVDFVSENGIIQAGMLKEKPRANTGQSKVISLVNYRKCK